MKANNLIEYAILNGEVNRVALNEAIKQLPEEIRQRFVEMAIGLVDTSDLSPKISQTKNIYGHENCRFLSYNYLYDRVNYEYEEEDVRWFKDEKDANRFSSTGDYSWVGERELKDEYNIKASRIVKHTSSCALSAWMEA